MPTPLQQVEQNLAEIAVSQIQPNLQQSILHHSMTTSLPSILQKDAGLLSAIGNKLAPLASRFAEKYVSTQSAMPLLKFMSAAGSKDILNAGGAALKNQVGRMGTMVGAGALGNPIVQKVRATYGGKDFTAEDALKASLTGAGIGAIGGAGLGAGSFAHGAGKAIGSRFKAISELANVGILPDSIAKAETALSHLYSNALNGSRPSEGWLSTAKSMFGGNNRAARIGYLTNANAGRGMMDKYVFSRMKTLGMNEIDAGTILNTNVVRSLNNPRIQQSLQNAGIKTVRGSIGSNAMKAYTPQELAKIEDIVKRLVGKTYHKKLLGEMGPEEQAKIQEKLMEASQKILFSKNMKHLSRMTGMSETSLRKLRLSRETLDNYISMRNANGAERVRELYVYGKKFAPMDFSFSPGQGFGVPIQYV